MQAFLFTGLLSLLYLYYLRNCLSTLMCIEVVSEEQHHSVLAFPTLGAVWSLWGFPKLNSRPISWNGWREGSGITLLPQSTIPFLASTSELGVSNLPQLWAKQEMGETTTEAWLWFMVFGGGNSICLTHCPAHWSQSKECVRDNSDNTCAWESLLVTSGEIAYLGLGGESGRWADLPDSLQPWRSDHI